jgi:adenosylmethionine-8-amino-7-oxononanoate aminotransferase
MSDLVILGTDTDVGKTTFALLWLYAFEDQYEYWKPVETGESDTQRVRSLLPSAEVHEPVARFATPVAPALAARLEGGSIPSSGVLRALWPSPRRPGGRLLIETFGSPLSPLNENELQVNLIQRLNAPLVLVCSSGVGAIGRSLQCLHSLEHFAVRPRAVVLMGQPDDYAAEEISRHFSDLGVFSLQPPRTWDGPELHRAASSQQDAVLGAIRSAVETIPEPRTDREELSDICERDAQHVWHPYTALRDPDAPLVTVAAEHEFLVLADGRRVIDGISSWWTILHGHRHPVLMQALAEASRQIDHVHFAGVTHPWAVGLAELLLRDLPWQGGRVFFSDNGSTAVEVALKMAYQYWCHRDEPGRTLFVGFEHGYHGDTFGAMAAGRDPVFFGRFEPLLFRAAIVSLSAEQLEETLRKHPDQVAAVLIEPLVQGAGGMRMHSPQVLRALAEVAGRHEVLFIVDEALTGGFRLGIPWAHQRADINPDLICAAKTLAGGVLPLAATLAAPHVVAAFDSDDRSRTFFHGHSFTAHPLACAVAMANQKLFSSPWLPTRAATADPNLLSYDGAGPYSWSDPWSTVSRMQSFWQQQLAPLRELPQVSEVRIDGSIAAVELAVAGGYLADIGRHLRRRCLEYGVLLRPLGNVLYAMPPLCTSEASLAQIAEAMRRAVTSV